MGSYAIEIGFDYREGTEEAVALDEVMGYRASFSDLTILLYSRSMGNYYYFFFGNIMQDGLVGVKFLVNSWMHDI